MQTQSQVELKLRDTVQFITKLHSEADARLFIAAQAAFTAALEAGAQTFVFDETQAAAREGWQSLGNFRALTVQSDGALVDGDSSVELPSFPCQGKEQLASLWSRDRLPI